MTSPSTLREQSGIMLATMAGGLGPHLAGTPTLLGSAADVPVVRRHVSAAP